MRKGLLLLLLPLYLLACSKRSETVVEGIYTETNPVQGRTTLSFSGNKMIMKEKDYSNQNVFNYQIKGNTIELTPENNASYSTTHSFRVLDANTFEIGSLYMSIGLQVETMIFKK